MADVLAVRERLGFVGTDHVHDGVDQRQMRERLREVAEVTAGTRIDLLGVEPQRRGVAEQTFAEFTGALQLADLSQR